MSRFTVALVALLVLLAGCGGLPSGSNEPDREPYDVEEPINASVEGNESEKLLPGITTAGVTNPEELQEIHLEAIGNRSHTVQETYEYIVERENETTREVVERTVSVDPEAGIVFEVINQSTVGNSRIGFIGIESNRTEERWYGEWTLHRTAYEDGSVEYFSSEVEMATNERMSKASQPLFNPLSNPEEITTAGIVEAADGTYYVLRNGDNESADEGAESIDIRTLVREDGLVRQTIYERVESTDDERVNVTQTIEITDIGETTVERPDWYDEAIESG